MVVQISRHRMYVLAAILCMTGYALAQEPEPRIYRLPKNCQPVNYTIQLAFNMTDDTFNGTIVIGMKTTNNKSEDLTSITLHLGLNITLSNDMCILYNGTDTIPIGATMYDDSNSMVTMMLYDGVTLAYDTYYLLTCEFSSYLNTVPEGLFVGYYDSTSKYVAVNNRPTRARDMCPCFDEPQYQVPVSLQIFRPETHSTYSTANLANSTDPDENGVVMDTFEPTEPISLHTLGLLISNAPVSLNSSDLIVLAPNNLPSPSSSISELMNNITTMLGPFPDTPLYCIIVPDHPFTIFSANRFIFVSPEVFMDNVLPQHETMDLKLQLTEAFLRQILECNKTPQWWSDIWLSESIAAYIAVKLQTEDWLMKYLKIKIRSETLGVDVSNTHVPIVNSGLLDRYDIESVIANRTVKNEGLSVLSMWEDVMPEGLITKSILDYINLNKSVTTTQDLMDIIVKNILDNQSPYNVSETIPLLSAWLTSPWCPTVTYEPVSSSEFTICQSDNASTFPVSVSLATYSSRNWENYRQGLWLLDTCSNISLSNNNSLNPWAIFNLEHGPYIVDYGNSWTNIIQALKGDLISQKNEPSEDLECVRAELQHDALDLAVRGHLPIHVALNVLTVTQRDQGDWLPLSKAFDFFTAMIGDPSQSIYKQFSTFAASTIPPDLLPKLDLTNSMNNQDVSIIRRLMTPWLCQFNIGNCRQTTVELSSHLWQNNISAIAKSDIDNVACLGSLYGVNILSSLMAGYKQEPPSLLKRRFTIGIGCVADASSVQIILNATISVPSPFAKEDSIYILMALANNVQNVDILGDFIISNAVVLQESFGVTVLSNLIKALSKFRVYTNKLEVLTNEPFGLDRYVVQSAAETIGRLKAKEDWWSANNAELSASLPPAPTSAPTTGAPTIGPAGNVTTPKPSAAKSLMDFHIVSLLLAAAVSLLSINL